MKNKPGKTIFLLATLCLSVFTFFQPYQTVTEKMKITSLSTLAYASGEDGEEEGNPNDPIVPPFNFWEWLESLVDGIGYNGTSNN